MLLSYNKKLSDIDYCYATIDLLNQLEANVSERNALIRDYHQQVDHRGNILIGCFAALIPAVLWGFILVHTVGQGEALTETGNSTQVLMNIVGLIGISVFVYISSFLILRKLWHSGLLRLTKQLSESGLRRKLDSEVKHINELNDKIANNPVIKEKRIPAKFMSTQYITMLVRYLERGQASFLDEAVYNLTLELKSTGYYPNLKPENTLLGKEQNYLENPAYNHEVQVEKEGAAYG
jgi:hypothetical protein